MKRMRKLQRTSLASLLALVFLTMAAMMASGQGGVTFVAGDVILYCKPGTPQADVNALAQTVNATAVTSVGLADCYKLTLPANKKDDMSTLSAVAALKPDVRVRWVGVNQLFHREQAATTSITPNDPRFGEMWGLKMINMPQAWAVWKGPSALNSANPAVIDTGFAPKHEDMQGRYHPGSYNFFRNTADITARGTGDESQHGTHVAGTVIANTNNAIGVSGIDWQNMQVIALAAGNDQDVFQFDTLLACYSYLVQKKNEFKITCCNMSYGSSGDPNDTSNPQYSAIKACVDAGIVMIAAAGNESGDSHTHLPAGYPFVITVAAVGPTAAKASYSNFGKIEIAAPGGEQTADNDPNGILSTWNTTYKFYQGTSMATPHVTGVMALLLSVPGVTPKIAVKAMEDTANRTRVPVTTVPDPTFGYGLLDAYKALLRVAVRVVVLDPVGIDGKGNTTDPTGIAPPVETFKPKLRIEIDNALVDNVTIRIDDGPALTKDFILNHIESGNATGDNPRYVIAFPQKFDPKPPFQHRVTVSVPDPSGTGDPFTDTRIFTLTPHSIPPGLSMISIPYYESAADSPTGQFRTAGEVLGNDVQLYQYVPTPSSTPYVTFSNTQTGANIQPLAAAFQPTTMPAPKEDVAGAGDTRPVGLGYFIKANSTIPVITYGTNYTANAFRIPLHEGWNIIGDPFAYSVSFNSITVETSSGERIPIQQAVDRKLIQPFIYRYNNGEYQFRTLPDGILAAWEGHWVYVTPANAHNLSTNTVLTLLVPPTALTTSTGARSVKATRAANAAPVKGGPNNWTLRLIARGKNLTDSYNFVGVASNATDGEDNTKVPKPPMPSPFVTLGMTRAAAPGVLYAQDLRSPGGAKSWDMTVATDQPNTDVVVNWPDVRSVPKNYRLTLTDKVSGQTIDMRNQSSYQFNSGQSAGSRSFVLTARPTVLGGRALLTNVVVNQSRTDGRSAPTYEIAYNVSRDVRVEASILGFNGRVVAQLSSGRAVTTGDNRLVWNGRDGAGVALSAGTYVLQMRVITPENEVTRQTLPFVITGR